MRRVGGRPPLAGRTRTDTMANLEFFATRAEHEALVRFLFGSTGVRVFESYSGFGRELSEFRSFEELAAAFDVGSDPVGSGFAVLLQP